MFGENSKKRYTKEENEEMVKVWKKEMWLIRSSLLEKEREDRGGKRQVFDRRRGRQLSVQHSVERTMDAERHGNGRIDDVVYSGSRVPWRRLHAVDRGRQARKDAGRRGRNICNECGAVYGKG